MLNANRANQIHSELTNNGYTIVQGEEFIISDRRALDSFKSAWETLEEDRYLETQEIWRLRRYGKLEYLPDSGYLRLLPGSTYYQSPEYNKISGGIEREFAPLNAAIVDNEFFTGLLKYTFSLFEIDDADTSQAWIVHVHLFRVRIHSERPLSPTPEGVHRDGFPFGSIHLMSRTNLVGGVTTIYDLNDRPLETFTLEKPLDTIYLFDNRVKHSVSPLSATDGWGFRDLLIFGYHQQAGKYARD